MGVSNCLSVDPTTVIDYAFKYNIYDQYQRNNSSSPESMLATRLDELNIVYERNNRKVLDGKELDFYFPDSQLAVEINGIYWHSDARNPDKTTILTNGNHVERKVLHFYNTLMPMYTIV